jgi:hypothetical protein
VALEHVHLYRALADKIERDWRAVLIARLLKGARCPMVRWFMVFLTLACYFFKGNRLITDIKKPLSARAGTIFRV